MHLILKPKSHPDLEDIVITNNLFAVGRREYPFLDYDRDRTAKLSKRHARIFGQDNTIYLVDLGSLNGTSCNGLPVKHQPQVLNDGDVVGFGGLSYQVEVVESPTELVSDSQIDLSLILSPDSPGPLEPIVVTSFPFLINKNSPVFERYDALLPDAMAFLSRRHAHIFSQGDQLFVEDLGSTNGTYVDGVALDEQVRELVDGATLAFGSDHMRYRVHILEKETLTAPSLQPAPALRSVDSQASQDPASSSPDDSEIIAPEPASDDSSPDAAPNSAPGTAARSQLPPELAAELADPTGTIFVDSPTSFIDVYFVDKAVPAQGDDSEIGKDAKTGQTSSNKPSTAAQMRNSLFGERWLNPGLVKGVLASLVLVGIGGGFLYWQDQDLRRLQQEIDNENYAQALALSESMLMHDPNNSKAQDLGAKASLIQAIPNWSANYQTTNFAHAKQTLEEAQLQSLNNATDDAPLNLLLWATSVRAFVHQFNSQTSSKNDSDPFVLPTKVDQLLARWQADPRGHTRTLSDLKQQYPSFAPAHSQIFTDVRALRNLELDGQGLRELSASLQQQLKARSAPGTTDLIERYLSEFPKFSGARILREDLNNFLDLEAAVRAKQWHQAVQLIQEPGFTAEPFVRYAAALATDELPDADTMAKFTDALTQWSDGAFAESQAQLKQLADTTWPELGVTRLDQQQQMLDELENLREPPKTGSTRTYESRLFAFYTTLDATKDRALLEELRPNFQRFAKSAQQQASVALRAADQAWRQYQNSGGIQTEQRLDNRVSRQFTSRASQLTAAHNALEKSRSLYTQLEIQPPSQWVKLHENISREVAMQRSALENLEVISSDVRSRKLALLPPSS